MTPLRSKKISKPHKIFVLDTSVIIYDHESILNFEENDVAIPITVLEELDEFKKGRETKNYAAREFIRFLDKNSDVSSLQDWIDIPGKDKGAFKIVMNGRDSKTDANVIFSENKMDHHILNAALTLKEEEPNRKVILVSKDINLRLKAKSLNLQAEDYETGKVHEVEKLMTGVHRNIDISHDQVVLLYEKGFADSDLIPEVVNPLANGYYIFQSAESSALAYFNPLLKQYERIDKKMCYGIKPRNAEQTFALHALLNDDIKLVALQGVAGTGKTLLALAGALERRREYKQIFLARPIVPLSNKDIGFLPGDIKSKINPYMEPLWDNLKFIKNQYNESDKEHQQINKMIEDEKLVIAPLAYIRGRSLSDVIYIVDEAQNLSPHEVKTIITRAGENAKFIFTGDVRQIDTPYLDENSNGLSYIVDRLSGNDLFAHVELVKGERSALANLANDML